MQAVFTELPGERHRHRRAGVAIRRQADDDLAWARRQEGGDRGDGKLVLFRLRIHRLGDSRREFLRLVGKKADGRILHLLVRALRDDGCCDNRRHSRADRLQGATAEQFHQHDDNGGEHETSERCDDDDRQHLREIGLLRIDGARDDAGIGRRRILVDARGGLAVAGEIGFEQLPLGGRFALQGIQLHRIVAGTGRIGLQGIELAEKLALTHLRDLGIVGEAGNDLLALALDLGAHIRQLCAQALDARMAVEQRSREIGNLRLKLRLRFLEALDDLRAGDIGQRVERTAVLQGGANVFSACLRRRLLAAYAGQLGGDIGELAADEGAAGGRIAGLKQIGRGAVIGNLLFRLAHLFAQVGDFRLQPAGGLGIGVELGAALQR